MAAAAARTTVWEVLRGVLLTLARGFLLNGLGSTSCRQLHRANGQSKHDWRKQSKRTDPAWQKVAKELLRLVTTENPRPSSPKSGKSENLRLGTPPHSSELLRPQLLRRALQAHPGRSRQLGEAARGEAARAEQARGFSWLRVYLRRAFRNLERAFWVGCLQGLRGL